MFEVPVDVVCAEGFVPTYAHDGDAGADMRAAIEEPLTIQPGKSEWVGTGVRAEIPNGHVGLQFPRSGLGCKHGICQLVIVPYTKAKFWTVKELGESDRGEDGYGSTGVE